MEHKDRLMDLFWAAMKALDSASLVRASLHHVLWEGRGRRVVISVGKAAAAMARGVQEAWGCPEEAWVITKYGHGPAPEGWKFLEAGHPVLDQASLDAGSLLVDLFRSLKEEDRWWLLLSGGASSLVEHPHAGLCLERMQSLFHALLRSGLEIHSINLVRRHLSQIKGGGLLRLTRGITGTTFAISDVSEDIPASIGSGLMVPDPTTFAEAYAILEKQGWLHEFADVAAIFREGMLGKRLDTCKPSEVVGWDAPFQILASNNRLCECIVSHAASEGIRCIRLPKTMDLPIQEVISTLVKFVEESLHSLRPCLLCWGGEPTISVQGKGKGGRMQHLALGLLLALRGVRGWSCLATSTDGTDGPTEVAGAWVDDQTLERAEVLEIDAEAFWHGFDAYTFHSKVGTHWKTGPTGTNLCDVVLLSIHPPLRE